MKLSDSISEKSIKSHCEKCKGLLPIIGSFVYAGSLCFCLKIKDITELEKEMTQEQKDEAYADFRRVYPEGTPEIMCISEMSEEDYLIKIDLENLK